MPSTLTAAVLLLWIYVVYNKNRWILALITTCYVAEVVGVVTILTLSFENFQGAHARTHPCSTLMLTTRRGREQRKRMASPASSTAS